MIKKLKKSNNNGNTFIIVVVSLSFLAILTAALLVAIALCYRLKIMDINSRDNFYYLEQAMDEIYAGVGADSMEKLNEAYEETLEVIVYYDAESKSYITMNNDVANKMMKKTYMKKIKSADGLYSTKDSAEARIKSFITNLYDADSNAEGIKCAIDNVDLSDKEENDNLTILNLTLTRTAKYSTMAVGNRGEKDTFTQKISTDLIIGTPQLDVSFNTVDAALNDLFSFSMIADKGVEIKNSKVNITGDIYAAADFYNKDYNGTTNKSVEDTVEKALEGISVTGTGDGSTEATAAAKMYSVPVCSYGTSKTTLGDYFGTDNYKRYTAQNGTNESSMYSGIYMSNSDVVITANKVIVPGSLAAMNTTDLTISAISGNQVGKTDIWADSIILGGYSMKKGSSDLKGSDVTLNARCYISDDLEVNATGSSFALIGEYYGYNNSSTDTRSFSNAFLTQNGVFNNLNWDSDKNLYQTGQAHYNSSAVILNGENATLDLKDVTSMYIAGQSYIELTKKTTESKDTVSYALTNEDGEETGETADEDVDIKTYTYDKETSDFWADSKAQQKAALQDYKTGEAVSIKSNQLAYIPSGNVQEEKDSKGNVTGYYVVLNPNLLQYEPFKSTFKDQIDLADAVSKIPVIKTVISGNTHYFFDFSQAADDQGVNDFIAGYSQLFEEGSPATAFLNYDITDYDDFTVDALRLPTKANSSETDYTKIYSNSALTVKSGSTFHITANSSAIDALLKVADTINENDKAKTTAEGSSTEIGDSDEASGSTTVDTINTNVSESDAPLVANSVTTQLRSQYKEMKLLLSNQSKDAVGVSVAHAIGDSAITPINYFFKFSMFTTTGSKVKSISEKNFEQSGYGVWTSDEDVEVDVEGDAKGIIICMGDVTFGSKVTGFEGLIVCGGKVIVEQNMDFVANEEVVKSILRICEDKQDSTVSGKMYRQILMLFRSYGGDEDQDGISNVDDTESTKSISTIQFEDILEFNNWKKNVD